MNKKQNGQAIAKANAKRGDNIIDLMAALRASLKNTGGKDATPKALARKAKAKPTRRKAG